MRIKVNKISWEMEQLWKGCILASISHAIMVAQYPELSNEHSWDGMNYNVQDSSGGRGTITFHSEYCAGAFYCDYSNPILDINEYFNGISIDVVKLLNNETLQYLLGEFNGEVRPIITTAFWGTKNQLYSRDTFEEVIQKGGFLVRNQTQQLENSIEIWKEYYDMNEQQCTLLRTIYEQKIAHPNQKTILKKDDISKIETNDEEGIMESKTSFGEIGIDWEI